ncbi:MAG: membrane protein insertion efficiency factor YidD [Gemmatimonadaceae bacterium]|nr:membrane protein insertion efficiency factor YidD [Acetobacteraceae bacterium]
MAGGADRRRRRRGHRARHHTGPSVSVTDRRSATGAGESRGCAVIAAVLILLVRVYQWTLRPVIGANCRFEPSCSAYAIEALTTHGAVPGSWLTIRRVLRCNPWHEGGLDPVPPCRCHPKEMAH